MLPIVSTLLLAAGCPQQELALLPANEALWPGMQQRLEVSGLDADDVVWSASGGTLIEEGSSATFIAPAEAGAYTVTASSRSTPDRESSARLTVSTVDDVALEIDVADDDAVSGRRGTVLFAAKVEGDKGARARFQLGGQLAFATGALEIDVEIIDETHGRLTFLGTTIDGEGPLSDEEEAALGTLARSELFPALAMVPLDVACAAIEPRLMAALLMPWQAVAKYLTADREAQAVSFEAASACRFFTPVDVSPVDARPSSELPLLANGQFVPAAFGYLPFDAEGSMLAPGESNASQLAQALLLPTDDNVFGPGGSLCRGACGADCEPNNCGEPVEEFRCVKEGGRNTGEKQRVLRYTCGEHEGCIEHDDCYDDCNLALGAASFLSSPCRRFCDGQAVAHFGIGNGSDWAVGRGPFTQERSYDYNVGEPTPDGITCPAALTLLANPGSGLAPHTTVLSWIGDESTSGAERCRLDPGDRSGIITIEPCPASGSHTHTYAVPSDMRRSVATYTATLTQVGADVTASADVQATWLFSATEPSGLVPHTTAFNWVGFNLVGKPLSCTLDFGDGSAPAVIADCALEPGPAHTYESSGVYQAVLTVRGEDRPVSKTISIEVRPEDSNTSCEAIRDVSAWTGTASFSYGAAGANSSISVEHTANGTIQATLAKTDESESSATYISAAPTGNVSVHEIGNSLLPGAVNPQYEFSGSGLPVPPPTSLDTGSNFMVNFDLAECRYNVHIQVLVGGTSSSGSTPASPGSFWVASIQTPWLAIPTTSSVSDSGPYSAHSDDFIFDQQDLIEFYLVQSSDLIDILGEAGLGEATVSWQLTPAD